MNIDELLNAFGEYRAHAVFVPWVISLCAVGYLMGEVLRVMFKLLFWFTDRVVGMGEMLWDGVIKVRDVAIRVAARVVSSLRPKPKSTNGQNSDPSGKARTESSLGDVSMRRPRVKVRSMSTGV